MGGGNAMFHSGERTVLLLDARVAELFSEDTFDVDDSKLTLQLLKQDR